MVSVTVVGERVQQGERAIRGHLEDRAVAEVSAVVSRPVKGSVGRLHEFIRGTLNPAAVCERVQYDNRAIGSQLEDRAMVRGSAKAGRPIKIPVARLDEASERCGTIRVCTVTFVSPRSISPMWGL
jgi:hypothetical protein